MKCSRIAGSQKLAFKNWRQTNRARPCSNRSVPQSATRFTTDKKDERVRPPPAFTAPDDSILPAAAAGFVTAPTLDASREPLRRDGETAELALWAPWARLARACARATMMTMTRSYSPNVSDSLAASRTSPSTFCLCRRRRKLRKLRWRPCQIGRHGAPYLARLQQLRSCRCCLRCCLRC